MPEENDELLELVDEDGNKVQMEVLDILTVDDKEYALLMPPHEHSEEEEHDEAEVVVMRLKRDGEDYTLELIDNEEEFARVEEYIEQLEDEMEE
jgi:uncharacterized protein YrzB (UPF0473 family)